MKLNLYKIQNQFKKRIEIFIFLVLFIFTIFIVKIYNYKKEETYKNYLNLINNSHFQKSLNYVFNNLKPKYIIINHKVSVGDTFDEILKNYKIPDSEILKIKKKLDKNTLNNLKTRRIK